MDSDSDDESNGQRSSTFTYKPKRNSSSSVEDYHIEDQYGCTTPPRRQPPSSRANGQGGDAEEEGSDTVHPKSSGEQQSFYPTTGGGQHLRSRPVVTSQCDSEDDSQLPRDGEKPPFSVQKTKRSRSAPVDNDPTSRDMGKPSKKTQKHYQLQTGTDHEPWEDLEPPDEDNVSQVASSSRERLRAHRSKSETNRWELEEVCCEEVPEWITPCSLDPPTGDDLMTWFRIGKKKETIEDETLFCDEQVLKRILKNKMVFDNLNHKAILDARDRANPFELIGNTIFQNRSGMKMANIDAVFDFMFTGMRDESGRKIVDTDKVLYFADICAGPGGFTEYVLFRTKWHAKGFGITLKYPAKKASDFKLKQFQASNCETFEPFYGCHGDGDITRKENVISFSERIFDTTNEAGVHFVMGEGGISVEGEENKQELLTKQLVMCQFACALSILRKGGHFVCQVFDMFTPFLVGLIYLLYRCFDKVCIIRPVTSRPANSARFVACQGFRNTRRSVANYLLEMNDRLEKLQDTGQDIIEVVPLDILQSDKVFMEYVIRSNNRIGQKQISSLIKIVAFEKDRNLKDARQSAIRRECLKLWKIEDAVRKVRVRPVPGIILNECWKKLTKFEINGDVFSPKTLTTVNLPPDVHSWKWYYTCGSRYLIVGCGGKDCKGWNQRGAVNFAPIPNVKNLELPPSTILDVEVCELFDSDDMKRFVVEVIDAIAIDGKFVGNMPFSRRRSLIVKLCEALNQPDRTHMRLKRTHKLIEIEAILSRVKDISEKVVPRIVSYEEGGSYTQPRGVTLFKTIKNPWHLQYSRQKNQLYFYNSLDHKSMYQAPEGSLASYMDVLRSRLLWIWQHDEIRSVLDLVEGKASLSKESFTKQVIDYVAERTKP